MADGAPAWQDGGLWRFAPERDALLAEAHARPSTPLTAPALATRITTLSGEAGAEADRAHMAALCRRLGAPEPGPTARWCVLEADGWRLRWERHTEVSTWSFYRDMTRAGVADFRDAACDLAPRDWLASLPGSVLAAAHMALAREGDAHAPPPAEGRIAADVLDGAVRLYTSFRPGPDGFLRFLLMQSHGDPTMAGRVVQKLFEIETYRLLALLAFPLAGEATQTLSRLEEEATQATAQVRDEEGVEADRWLLKRLARLSGEAQALSARTRYRFAAARAYYGIVLERIHQLREQAVESRPTISEFMERRLAPAMRTCQAVADREQGVIEHLARTSQLLQTRVEVEAEVTNANLLRSMDQRASLQLRLQETVEGLSVAAISYYAIGLLGYVFKAAQHEWPRFDATLAIGVSAPFVIGVVWLMMRRMRAAIAKAH
jgi:uncharacterized membrane-anchored protein